MQLNVLFIVLVSAALLPLLQRHQTIASMAKPGCQEKCGNVTVLYPFGIGEGCYLDKQFEIECNSNGTYFQLESVQGLSISEISFDSVRVFSEAITYCSAYGSRSFKILIGDLDPRFSYSHDHNMLVGMGCEIFAYITDSVSAIERRGCVSLCNNTNHIIELSACSGINGCCEAAVPEGLREVDLSIASIGMYNESQTSRPCSTAFIVEKGYSGGLTFNTTGPNIEVFFIPVVVNWVIDNITCQEALVRKSDSCSKNGYCIDSSDGFGYRCSCLQGYQGNPYLPGGCQDIKECEEHSISPCKTGYHCINTSGSYHCACPPGYISDGKGLENGCRLNKATSRLRLIIGTGTGTAAVLLLLGSFGDWLYRKNETRKKNMIKNKNFERNGGLLLQQQNSFSSANEKKPKHFLTEEMERATENFKESRVLGKGGYGTVYKGMLSDGSIVAIKKSNVIDEGQVSRFINKVFILSQINHRNIVKLLGCCLEYDVPLLVYEYVSNGTLSYHLHNYEHVSTLPWSTRLRIASEIAGALAYLHSYASIAIFHGDIKSENILLDENFRTVVSDFGLSKPVSVTKTHLTTLVRGTFGYLDPEYFRTGRLTNRSDVYAFGVVLAELLTGRRAVPLMSSDDGLAHYFKCSMKHNCLFETLETLVVNGGREEEIITVAKLAKRCLEMNSKRRPSMKEVVADLDRLRRLHRRKHNL